MDNQQEGSLQMLHTGGSGYRRRSHLIHKQADEKAMQREIDDLKKRFRRAQRKQTPSSSDVSSNDDEDASYRQRLGTSPSESYSYEEEHSRKRRRSSPSGRGVGTYIMHFHQPTFTMYNGRTDPIKHVSQFKQRMIVHS